MLFCFFKQKTAYEMRISDWSADVCSSDLCAIKTARAYHQHEGDTTRFELITFKNAFHGRTMATISASNQEKMHHGFSPLLTGFKYAEFDDLDSARALIGPNTAGFLVAPIQGEGGIRPASEAFMRGQIGRAHV